MSACECGAIEGQGLAGDDPVGKLALNQFAARSAQRARRAGLPERWEIHFLKINV